MHKDVHKRRNELHRKTTHFLQRQGIRSYQEMRVLLFFCRQPDFAGTCADFCERLYLGDCALLERIIHRFKNNGLLEQCDGCYKLADQPGLKTELDRLARAFDEPLTRQQILASISQTPPAVSL